MTKNVRIVLAIIEEKRTVTDVAKEFGVSRTWVYELLGRHKILGLPGLTHATKKPHSNSRALTHAHHQEIAKLRRDLTGQGLDGGAQTIRFHLLNRHGHAPAISTIWRSLRNQGLVEYQPQKKT